MVSRPFLLFFHNTMTATPRVRLLSRVWLIEGPEGPQVWKWQEPWGRHHPSAYLLSAPYLSNITRMGRYLPRYLHRRYLFHVWR